MEFLYINWNNTFVVVVMALSIVFVILTLLVFVMNYLHKIIKRTEALPPAKSFKSQAGDEHLAAIAATLHLNATPNNDHIAAIAATLHLYFNDAHDAESGVLTIKPHKTDWNLTIFSINKK